MTTATATETAADPRAVACAALETAFAKRDWPGLYRAADSLSRASFEMGRKKGAKYAPLNAEAEAPPPDVPVDAAPRKEWSVGQIDSSLIRFKRESVVFTVVRGDDPTAVGRAIAFCDNGENAELIARALAAYKEE